jgi:hypothetical protein
MRAGSDLKPYGQIEHVSVGKAAKAAAEMRDYIVAFLAPQGSKVRKRGFRSSARRAKKIFDAQGICFAAPMMAPSAC